MSKKNKNSKMVYQYDANGELVGRYNSITDASNASGYTAPTIATALKIPTHRAKEMYFLESCEQKDLNDAIALYNEKLRKREERLKTNKYYYVKKVKVEGQKRAKRRTTVDDKVERRGDYIFIETNFTRNNDCCIRCALACEEECFPCDCENGRTDGKKGYWRYCKKMTF